MAPTAPRSPAAPSGPLDEAVRPSDLDPEAFAHAAECLKTIAHPHRLRMIALLLEAPHTVGELADACGIPSHAASEHLRLMRDRGLLEAERDGRRTYHRVAEPGLAGIIHCVACRFGGPG